MEQKDYLLRQIDQLGQVLGYILSKMSGLKEIGNLEQATDFAYSYMKEELKFDLDKMLEIVDSQSVEELVSNFKFNNSNLLELSEIIRLIAESYEKKNDLLKAKNMYKKVLYLLEYINKNETTFSFEIFYKIDEIKSYL